jgi:hypothetical protein
VVKRQVFLSCHARLNWLAFLKEKEGHKKEPTLFNRMQQFKEHGSSPASFR